MVHEHPKSRNNDSSSIWIQGLYRNYIGIIGDILGLYRDNVFQEAAVLIQSSPKMPKPPPMIHSLRITRSARLVAHRYTHAISHLDFDGCLGYIGVIRDNGK